MLYWPKNLTMELNMKKIILSFIILGSISASAFATTTLNCKSANYEITVADIEEFAFANYGINGVMNDGADVEVENSYVTDRVVAMALKVDGQSKKFELAVSKSSQGKYTGRIFTGKSAQDAKCTRK